MPPNTIGEPRTRAAVLLAMNGMSQHALAEQAGVSQMAVSRYLAGSRAYPHRFAMALVDLLGEADALRVLDAIPEREGVVS